MADPMNRRGFFVPRGLLRAVEQMSADVEHSLGEIEKMASAPVVTLRREAMACQFELQFPMRDSDRKAALAAFDLIDDLEAQMTVYNDESEVSRLNAGAFPSPVPVEPLLFKLLTRCRDLTNQTEGAFDITSGPLIRAWGFKRRQGRIPDAVEIGEVLRNVGMGKVILDDARQTLCFTQPGVEINLGGIGKGYALDRVGQRLRLAQQRSALLSAGHSSLLAIGQPTWDDAWQVELLHPLDIDQGFAVVRLRDQGFSTSGISQQFFEQDGKRYGHLLDPRTGWPVEGMLQTSVVAPDAALAEALSTAFFVLGCEWTEQYCSRHPEIGALLVPDPGPDQPLRPRHFGSIDIRLRSGSEFSG